MLTIEELLLFFKERGQLTPFAFGKEAGISPRLMDYILKKERNLTGNSIRKLLPVMKKYGYKATLL